MLKNIFITILHLALLFVSVFYFIFNLKLVPELNIFSFIGANIYLTMLTHDAICIYYLIVLIYDFSIFFKPNLRIEYYRYS
mmetsp:Transcript_10885/g.978  ORF Transcript_10885/g.978 Transcript_10885/m.978 type:complete len:81 (+) Transcript_10885:56-298(+)